MHFLTGALSVRVFLCFAYAYVLSYAFRSVNAVIAPVLQHDMQLSAGELGLLTSGYLLAFAALQLPLGIWLDRYGPRRTEAALLLLAATGSAIFAASESLTGLWIGRALIGAGVSACLMASLKAYRLWFAPERQGQLASLMLVAGTAGVLLATVPVNSALPLIGWRGVFWAMSGMIVLASAAIFFLLKKVETLHEAALLTRPAAPAPAAPASAPARENRGYRDIFRNPYFRRMALVGMVNNGSFLALQTLWVGPWMTTVLGMSNSETAKILFVVNLCLLLAYLTLSWCALRYISHDGSRGWTTHKAIAVGLTGTLLAQSAMILGSAQWTWVLWIMFAAFVPVTILAQASISLAFPPEMVGRANGGYNLVLFIGAFLVQWGIGVLIDFFSAQGLSTGQAMRAAFALSLACQVAALITFMLNQAQPEKI